MSGSTVALIWRVPTGAVPTMYVIEAGSYPGGRNLVPGLRTNSLATTFVARDVPPGTYVVRLRALYGAQLSDVSNEIVVSVTGSSCAAPPGAVSGLSYSVTGSVLSLTWNPAAGHVTSYVIAAGSTPAVFDLARADTGSTLTTLVARGIARGTYYIRVQGRNACGMGPGANLTVVVP